MQPYSYAQSRSAPLLEILDTPFFARRFFKYLLFICPVFGIIFLGSLHLAYIIQMLVRGNLLFLAESNYSWSNSLVSLFVLIFLLIDSALVFLFSTHVARERLPLQAQVTFLLYAFFGIALFHCPVFD